MSRININVHVDLNWNMLKLYNLRFEEISALKHLCRKHTKHAVYKWFWNLHAEVFRCPVDLRSKGRKSSASQVVSKVWYCEFTLNRPAAKFSAILEAYHLRHLWIWKKSSTLTDGNWFRLIHEGEYGHKQWMRVALRIHPGYRQNIQPQGKRTYTEFSAIFISGASKMCIKEYP